MNGEKIFLKKYIEKKNKYSIARRIAMLFLADIEDKEEKEQENQNKNDTTPSITKKKINK